MKMKLLLAAIAATLVTAAAYATVTCTTKLCFTDGALTVNSGGAITVESGASLTVAGVTIDESTLAVNDLTASAAELNYNDITTLGTAAASKTITSDASLDTIIPTGGLFTFQSGSGLTLNSGSTLIVDAVTVNKKALSLPGRAEITICGDGTTINNNTVYYGPSMVPVASGERTCDITQVGNATEATADAPAFDNTAFQVLSMDCLTADPGAAGVSFTLRDNAGGTTPSVTCSVANTKLGCTANVQTTTAVAAGDPIAIAAASTGNQGATPFACTIHVAY